MNKKFLFAFYLYNQFAILKWVESFSLGNSKNKVEDSFISSSAFKTQITLASELRFMRQLFWAKRSKLNYSHNIVCRCREKPCILGKNKLKLFCLNFFKWLFKNSKKRYMKHMKWPSGYVFLFERVRLNLTCTDKNFKLNVILWPSCILTSPSSAGYVLLTTCFLTQNVYPLTFMTGVIFHDGVETSLNFIIVDFSRI